MVNQHINSAPGHYSPLDLSVLSMNIAQKLQWQVLNDAYDSNHFPIIKFFYDRYILAPKVKNNKESLSTYHKEPNFFLLQKVTSIDEDFHQFTESFTQTAIQIFKLSKTKFKVKYCNIW